MPSRSKSSLATLCPAVAAGLFLWNCDFHSHFLTPNTGRELFRKVAIPVCFQLRLLWHTKCNSTGMILLITTSAYGQECATALLAATRIRTELARDIRTALLRLREQEFTAVILDESLLEPSAKTIDLLVKHLGRAVPVFVNLAVSRMERVVRDVQAALRRAEQERSLARNAAEADLRSQLRGELTGILLWTQQALEIPSLPSAAEAKLKSVYEVADKIRTRLGVAT